MLKNFVVTKILRTFATQTEDIDATLRSDVVT